MTDDEIDAAIRAAVPEACFAPNDAARAIYIAGLIDGINLMLGNPRKPPPTPYTEPATEPAAIRALAD